MHAQKIMGGNKEESEALRKTTKDPGHKTSLQQNLAQEKDTVRLMHEGRLP